MINVKLINDFFELLETSPYEKGFISTIKLNAGHVIYKAHFPGHPLTPGVIQIQMIHELLQNHLGKKIILKSISQGKFLKIINPIATEYLTIRIQFETQEELFIVRASAESGNESFFKFNMAFQYQQ